MSGTATRELRPFRVHINGVPSVTVSALDVDHAEHLARFEALPDGRVIDHGPAWSVTDLTDYPDENFCTNCGHATDGHDLPAAMAAKLGKVCGHVGCKCNKLMVNVP